MAYTYSIGKYEVTNAQYAEFLNAKAASDTYGLYNDQMSTPNFGGITRTGSSGSYSYSTIAGHEEWPVNYVSSLDAMRFANWLNNGQGNGDTETGSYTLLGGTAIPEIPSNYQTVTRNPGATFVLTSEDEWYKAAYYDPQTASYFDYPAGSDTQTTCSQIVTATPNTANCSPSGFNGFPLPRGNYLLSASPYGTFDQGGNVAEWNETTLYGCTGPGECQDWNRGMRGGAFRFQAPNLAARLATLRCLTPCTTSAASASRVSRSPEPASCS